MQKETNLTLGISDSEIVDAYMKKLKHPLADLTAHIRSFIKSVDNSIGEGIYWNAPTFYYTGKMKPFNPKTYKRYIVGFNFYKSDALRLVFLRGVLAEDKSGLLTGDYADGRRIMTISSLRHFQENEAQLGAIIKKIIKKISD